MTPDDAVTNPSIDRAEHDSSASAKRVEPLGWTGTTTKKVPIPFIDVAYDTITMSNADGNGNYQTLVFSLASVTQRTLSLAFDGNSNVTSIARS